MKELEAIRIVLAGIKLLREFGINYGEVIAAQQAAEAEGRELTEEDIAPFVADSREAVDRL